MPRSSRLQWAFALSCCIIIFLILRGPPCLQDIRSYSIISPLNRTKAPISSKSIFVYKAYLDRRLGLSFIRLLSLNRCWKKGEPPFLTALINGKWEKLSGLTIESGCPWSWARGCSLVPHYHEVAIPKNFSQTEVLIKSRTGTQKVNLFEVLVLKEPGLTICIPPLYWYTDWMKLVVFIEYWRLNGATQFFFYHHSSSADVQKVFDYYSQEDWMTVIPWPLLPASDRYDPNFYVYRIGHSLAHNDCMLRSRTKSAVLVDVDELIYTRNESLPSLIRTAFKNSSICAILFNHHTLQYDPPIFPAPFDFEAVDFKGVTNSFLAAVEGPKKVVFAPATVKRLGVHGVTQYLRGGLKTIQIKSDKAILLHNRFNHKEMTGNTTQVKFSLIHGNEDSFQRTLLERKKQIFPDGASFSDEPQEALAACTEHWRNTQFNCKNPVEGCRHVMQPMEQWVESTDDLYFVF